MPKVNNLLIFFFSQYQATQSLLRTLKEVTSMFLSYIEVSMQTPEKCTDGEFVFKKLRVSALSDVLVEYTQLEVL